MKTKLTLYVAVIAVALFGMGCASVPKPDVANAIKWNGHYYALLAEKLSWEDAKAACEKLGGHLVIIESEAENDFLWDLISKEEAVSDTVAKHKHNVFLHIGCLRINESEGWKWLNGESVVYSKWSAETPLDRNTYGGMTLSSVNGYPTVKPGD